MSTAVPTPLGELSEYVAGFASRCKASRWFGALFHVEVCRNIVADVRQQQAQIASHAYSAEQADREAAKILDEVMEDGRVTPSEFARLRLARKHINLSERIDHDITEQARFA